MVLTPAAKFSISRRCPGGTGRRRAEPFSQPPLAPPAGWGSCGWDPSPAAGGRRAAVTQRPRLLPAPRATRTSGPPPPPPAPPRASPAEVTARPGGQGPAAGRGAEGSPRGAHARPSERSPPRAAGEGMSADSVRLRGRGGSGAGRRRRAEAPVQASAAGRRGRRCACPSR